MALIVVEMGRRVITPHKTERRGTVKTQATKSDNAIDQYTQFRQLDAHKPAPQHTDTDNQTDPDCIQKQHQMQKKPSRISLLSEIMSTAVINLGIEARVADAWQLFQQHGFHHIPIIDRDNKVLAILSDRDILRGPGTQRNINLESIMQFATQQVFCFSPDTDIRQATRILYEYDLGALLVISNEHELLGIVSRTDIINAVSHYGPLELWA